MENVAGNREGRNPDNYQVGVKFSSSPKKALNFMKQHDVVIKVGKLTPKTKTPKLTK